MSAIKVEVSGAVALVANGNAAFTIPFINPFGAITAYVTGTFGSGTAKLEYSIDGTNWFDSGIAGITAAGTLKLTGVACNRVRVVVTGSTTPAISVRVAF